MSGGHSVEKVGGTSMAATQTVVDNVFVAGRTGADLYGRIFVVSAFAGMTDLLLEDKRTRAPGVYAQFAAAGGESAWREALEAVRGEMFARNRQMLSSAAHLAQADALVATRLDEIGECLADLQRLQARGHFQLGEPLATLREMLAGLGEAHSAHAMALLLQERDVNAVFVDLTGWGLADPASLDDVIGKAFADLDLATQMPVVTGYARCDGGMVRQWDRGYSEMTFSRIAVLTAAREAIIHKEFHLSSADPRLVGTAAARKIGRTNYDVADQLANLGMEAIHPGAGRGLRQAGIPLRVRNTFDREDEGTLICGEYVPDSPRVEIVTGLRSLFALEFFEPDMVGVKGFDAAILETLTRERARIVSKASNANTITHYLACPKDVAANVVASLEARFPTAAVQAREVAIVSVIGGDIGEPGLVGDAMAALSAAGVGVIGLQHQIRNVDVQFVIEPGDFERATVCLHEALVVARAPASADRAAA